MVLSLVTGVLLAIILLMTSLRLFQMPLLKVKLLMFASVLRLASKGLVIYKVLSNSKRVKEFLRACQ